LSVKLLELFYNTGQMSDLIHHKNFAKSCVFIKQSQPPIQLHYYINLIYI